MSVPTLLPLHIDIYTRSDCPACKKAIELINRYHLQHTIYLIGRDLTREDVLAKFPDANMLPIVLVNDNVIGNYPQFVKFIATTDFSKYQRNNNGSE